MLDIGPRGVYDLVQEIAHNVTKIKNKKKIELILGIMVKLNEASEGNFESVRQMTLEDTFDDYFSPFAQFFCTA
jgi:hypothetical protein